MATIQKSIVTKASPAQAWDALRDVGALHTRLVPGFVVDTRIEPGARVVTFGNGAVLRERIVSIDDNLRRVVWTADEAFAHHNGAAQVLPNEAGGSKIVWTADILPDEAAAQIEPLMEQGMAVMRSTLDALCGAESRDQ